MLALIEASTTGDLVAVQRLLAANPRHLSLDERDCHNGTALIHASYKGFADIVRILVAANAGVNLAADDGEGVIGHTAPGLLKTVASEDCAADRSDTAENPMAAHSCYHELRPGNNRGQPQRSVAAMDRY